MYKNDNQKCCIFSIALLAALAGCAQAPTPGPVTALPKAKTPPPAVPGAAKEKLVVTTTADAGEGSLRAAILAANAHPGPDTIVFDSLSELFAKPQTIRLESELPALEGELTIDGYIEGHLWKAIGVTVSGDHMRRVFRVSPATRVAIRNLTIAEGHADNGGGIVNEGELVITGVTFLNNTATQNGGAIANQGGNLTVINSTFSKNTAASDGGGLGNLSGRATVTNATFSENKAAHGGGLFSDGTLILRNTILANSAGSADCVSTGKLDAAGTHNIIEINEGCGTPLATADPNFEPLGAYNGPTLTYPLNSGSPAINMGDNAAAVDEHGEALEWDQRGNGDPRFVAGYTDIGAFEVQAYPDLIIDTAMDTEARGCTIAGKEDCSLRGAVMVVNAMGKADHAHITFAPDVFKDNRTVMLKRPLPELTIDMSIDGTVPQGVKVITEGDFPVLTCAPGVEFKIHAVQVGNGVLLPDCMKPSK